ncbi:MAG: DUF2520 domain-containing protein [Bacteroidota bacterium]|nr:DUF2520 domain-containing protein [Bacteroidota bacterium]
MDFSQFRKIVLIGAGNVAFSLGPELVRNGFQLIQICNRSEVSGKKLALKTGAEYCSDPAKISPDADLYIFSVSDNALPVVIKGLNFGIRTALIISGTIDSRILKGIASHYGVVYPVQTFNRAHPRRFLGIPLCVEGSDPDTERQLLEFAGKLSERVHSVNLEQRRYIHLSAVLANNFSNYLYSTSEEMLKKKGVSYEILFPLIRQTARNACRSGVFSFQTGPAIREDRNVMETHLEMLKDLPDLKKIYLQISENIINRKILNDKL